MDTQRKWWGFVEKTLTIYFPVEEEIALGAFATLFRLWREKPGSKFVLQGEGCVLRSVFITLGRQVGTL